MRNTQFSEKSEALLRQKAADNLLSKRSDTSKKWLHRSGRGYKIAVIAVWILTVYSLIMFLAQSFGFLEKASGDPRYMNDARTALICCGILAVSGVFLWLKKHLPASVTVIVFSAFYFINARALLTTQIIQQRQIVQINLFVPSTLLIIIAALFIIVTAAVDRMQLNAEYNRLVDKITRTYTSKDGSVTTQEEWEQHIADYFEPTEHVKPKKSLRQKAKKDKT